MLQLYAVWSRSSVILAVVRIDEKMRCKTSIIIHSFIILDDSSYNAITLKCRRLGNQKQTPLLINFSHSPAQKQFFIELFDVTRNPLEAYVFEKLTCIY